MQPGVFQNISDVYKSGDMKGTQDLLAKNFIDLEQAAKYFNLNDQDTAFLRGQGVTGYTGGMPDDYYASNLIGALRSNVNAVNPNTGFKTWENKPNGQPLNFTKRSPIDNFNQVPSGAGSNAGYVPPTAPPLKTELANDIEQSWRGLGIESDPTTGLPTNMNQVDMSGLRDMINKNQVTAQQARSTYKLNDDDMRWLDDVYDVDFYEPWEKTIDQSFRAGDKTATQDAIRRNQVTAAAAKDQFNLNDDDINWLVNSQGYEFYDPYSDIEAAYKAGDYGTVNSLKRQYKIGMDDLQGRFGLNDADMAWLARMGIS